jgi:hypothetical protein
MIYAGNYAFCPKQIPPFNDFTTHPRNFCKLDYDVFTNNPILVKNYPFDEVVLISPKGKFKKLSEHPEAKKWKDEFDAGEFWSFVGESWIDD